MQIRHSRDLEGRARAAPSPMTVDELFARFPEVPRDLRDEPVLAEFVRAFGAQLRVAQKPSPCVAQALASFRRYHLSTLLAHPLDPLADDQSHVKSSFPKHRTLPAFVSTR